MFSQPRRETEYRLRWRDIYSEAELCRSALRIYTKPLFQWRKALCASVDGRTLYDFASRGLRGLDELHSSLRRERFVFRPALALPYNFNGKHRTLYISPWEERIVDLLLYRVLNRRLHRSFSQNTYAYRDRAFGLDTCQCRIAKFLRSAGGPIYLVKRDIANYFGSVNHDLLLERVRLIIDETDYLFRLVEQRIAFSYSDNGRIQHARVGIPFGSAMACLLANIYLQQLDRRLEAIPELNYFRYADDLLLMTRDRHKAIEGAQVLERLLAELRLTCKPSHSAEMVLSRKATSDNYFVPASHFRHLGLRFDAGGGVSLARDKQRKIQNLFRFAFRRNRRRWKKATDAYSKARLLADVAADVITRGVRNVAIIDYYLKHVDDEQQLRLLDRWLAEEVLSLIFGGHKQSHFRRMSFTELRALGLPSLVHRRRLILRGEIESPFFMWRKQRAARTLRGTVARL